MTCSHDHVSFLSSSSQFPSQTITSHLSWRIPERIKTVSGALVLCLHLGVDPPDVYRLTPCARLQCWLNPYLDAPSRAREQVGKALQSQYEHWQPRLKYKIHLDPTVEELRKSLMALRKGSKSERILFHYNGHGVPRPTKNGELWLFNAAYTQYIPVSVADVNGWLGAPALLVFDCSAAGNLFNAYRKLLTRLHNSLPGSANKTTPRKYEDEIIILAACGAGERLPMNNEMPADLFTACLTTPVETAVLWHLKRGHHSLPLAEFDLPKMIPGRAHDRRTPLGELNWIFTAITDAIAWSILPSDLFKTLFRQDALVAGLFRHFLLAERIMKSFRCSPMSWPPMPESFRHPLWALWDEVLDNVLGQLHDAKRPDYFMLSSFFVDQLDSFERWIEAAIVGAQIGDSQHTNEPPWSSQPEQLPILLQVILCPDLRLRALSLLNRYLDLDLSGWSVIAALNVGLFPYFLRLLQASTAEIRPHLTYSWIHMLRVDTSCESDLMRDDAYRYFLTPLVGESREDKEVMLLSLVALTMLIHENQSFKELLVKEEELLDNIFGYLSLKGDPLQLWGLLFLSELCKDYEEAKRTIFSLDPQVRTITSCLYDGDSRLRAVFAYFCGCFIAHNQTSTTPGIDDDLVLAELSLLGTLLEQIENPSPLFRRELVFALSHLVSSNVSKFTWTAYDFWLEVEGEGKIDKIGGKETNSKFARRISEPTKAAAISSHYIHSNPAIYGASSSSASTVSLLGINTSIRSSSIYSIAWKALLVLAMDPVEAVSRHASNLVDEVHMSFLFPASRSLFRRFADDTTCDEHSEEDHDEIVRLKAPAEVLFVQHETSSGFSLAPNPPLSTACEKRMARSFSEHADSLEKAGFLGTKQVVLESSFPLTSLMLQEFVNQFIGEHGRKQAAASRDERLLILNATIKKAMAKHHEDCHTWLSRPSSLQKVDDQLAILDCGAPVLHVLFHPFASLLLTIDNRNHIMYGCGWRLCNFNRTISVWNWKNGVKVNMFSGNGDGDVPDSNRHPTAKITDAQIIMPSSEPAKYSFPLLITASCDGILRLWQGFESTHNQVLVSAFRASHVDRHAETTGLYFYYAAEEGCLYVVNAGGPLVIKVYDLKREKFLAEIDLGLSNLTNGPLTLTCICGKTRADEKGKKKTVLAIGFSDGSIRIYSPHAPAEQTLLLSIPAQGPWIVSISMPSGLENLLVSANVAGEVCVYALDDHEGIHKFSGFQSAGLAAFVAHARLPLFACGSLDQCIRFYLSTTSLFQPPTDAPPPNPQIYPDARPLNILRHHEGFLGQRLGPVTAIAFHPQRPLFAVGASDALLTVYGVKKI